MKNKEMLTLEKLLKIPSPSGFEENIAEFIYQELLRYLPKKRVNIDKYNNVTAIIKGTSRKTVMIDAHLDEIGFVVTNVNRNGLISIKYIGGGDNSILSARELVILTDKGPINAVVDRQHAHLVEDEDDERIVNICEAAIDIGIRGRKAVLRKVKIGDPVVHKTSCSKLVGSFYAGYGFDDKAGCYILLETIAEIVKSKKKPTATLVFTFSSQEEIGGHKTLPLVAQYKPDLFIEVDVTFATDYLYDSRSLEEKVGKCELGKGIVLYRGVDIDKDALKLMESTARTNKFKVQYQAAAGGDGYTSTEMTQHGTKAIVMGIPLRNMHSPVEIINLTDLKTGYNLLKSFLLNQRLERVLEKMECK